MEPSSSEELHVEVGLSYESEIDTSLGWLRVQLYLKLISRVQLGRSHSASPPAEFLCPISQRLMQEPVVLVGSGHTYERRCIQAWLLKSRHRPTCPMTGTQVSSTSLVVNWALKHSIENWQEQQVLSALPRIGSQLLPGTFGVTTNVTLRLADNNMPLNPKVLYGQWLTHVREGVWSLVEVVDYHWDRPAHHWQLCYHGSSECIWGELLEFNASNLMVKTDDGEFRGEWLSCEVATEHSSSQDHEDEEEDEVEEEARSTDLAAAQVAAVEALQDANPAAGQEAAGPTTPRAVTPEATPAATPSIQGWPTPEVGPATPTGTRTPERLDGDMEAGTSHGRGDMGPSPGSSRGKVRTRKKVVVQISSDGHVLNPEALIGERFKARGGYGGHGGSPPCMFEVLGHCRRWGKARWKLQADDATSAGWYSFSDDLQQLNTAAHPELVFRDSVVDAREQCREWLREQLQQLREALTQPHSLGRELGQGAAEKMRQLMQQLGEKLRQVRQQAGAASSSLELPVRWLGIDPCVVRSDQPGPVLPVIELMRGTAGQLLNCNALLNQKLWVGASSEPLTISTVSESCEDSHNALWGLADADGRLYVGCFNWDFSRFRNESSEAGRVEWAGCQVRVVDAPGALAPPQVELQLAADNATVLNAEDLLGHQLECVWEHKSWQQGIMTRVMPAGNPNRWGICFENGEFKWGRVLEDGRFRMPDGTKAVITWLTCSVTWRKTQLRGPLPSKKPTVVIRGAPAGVALNPEVLIGQPLLIGTSCIRADIVGYKSSSTRYRWLVRYDGGDEDWGDFDGKLQNFHTIYRKRCVKDWLACEPRWEMEEDTPEQCVGWMAAPGRMTAATVVVGVVLAGSYLAARAAVMSRR